MTSKYTVFITKTWPGRNQAFTGDDDSNIECLCNIICIQTVIPKPILVNKIGGVGNVNVRIKGVDVRGKEEVQQVWKSHFEC